MTYKRRTARKVPCYVGAATVSLMLGATAAQAQELTVWTLPSFGGAEADALIDELLQEYASEAGIEAELVIIPSASISQRLAAAYEAGTLPDVFQIKAAESQFYINQGITAPVTDVLEELRSVEGGIFEATLPAVMRDGEAHGVPVEVSTDAMYVRTDLLEEVGMNVPGTWEEFRETAEAIADANLVQVPFGLPLGVSNDTEGQLREIIWSHGGALFAEDGETIVFDSPETRAALTFVKEMFDAGLIPRSSLTWDSSGNNRAYQTGQAAFIVNQLSVYQYLRDNDQELFENTDLAPLPRGSGENGRQVTLADSFVWTVSAQSEEQDLAKGWLRYFYEPENYREVVEFIGGRFGPIYKGMYNIPLFADDPRLAGVPELIEAGLLPGYQGPPTPISAEIWASNMITNAVQSMLIDDLPVEEVTADLQQQMEAVVAEHTAKATEAEEAPETEEAAQ